MMLGDQDIVVARITTQEYVTPAVYSIHQWKHSGLLAQSYARLGKLATLEKQFVLRLPGKLDADEIPAVKSILKNVFSL